MKSDEDFNHVRDVILCQNFHSLGPLFRIKLSFISVINIAITLIVRMQNKESKWRLLNTMLIPKPELEEAVLHLPAQLPGLLLHQPREGTVILMTLRRE